MPKLTKTPIANLQVTPEIRDRLNEVIKIEQKNHALRVTQKYMINKLIDFYLDNYELEEEEK